MKHLQIVISAVLLAGSVVHVDAAPPNVDDDSDICLAHKVEVFSKVTPESLAKTLHFEDGVEISDTFTHILVSLSRDPREDGIYLMMSDTFLWGLHRRDIAQDFVFAWITLCFIIYKDRENRAWNKAVPVEDLLTDAIKVYYGGVLDLDLSDTFYGLAPLISNAMKGNVEEAKKIFPILAEQFDKNEIQQLNGMGKDSKMKILRRTSKKLHDWVGDGGATSSAVA